MIVTPMQLTHRAELYHQLSQFTATGIGVIRALEQIKANPPDRSFREPVGRILEEMNKGATVAEALRRVDWLPAFDMALVDAGERTGRLDATFRVLADYYNDRARLAKQVLADLAYPVFLFHFAALIFLIIMPFARAHFNASLLWIFLRALLILSPFYIVTWLMIYASQSKHGEEWRAFMEKILHWVPRLGAARRSLALGRLALALEALINAGINIVDAWEHAAAASGSPALKQAVAPWRPHIDAGRTPSEMVRECGIFPEMFRNFYNSGEVSGRLDDSLKQLYAFYQDEGTRKMHGFAMWTPRLFYLGIAGVIGFEIIKSYTAYFNQISNIMNGF